MNAVTVRHVTKTFKGKKAVNDISFTIKEGSIVSILGPNGAGKTTTMMMMLGLIQCTEGIIQVFGKEPGRKEVRERIGAMLQEVSVPDGLTVGEIIDLFRSYYVKPLPKQELLKLAGLQDVVKKKADKLSGGLKRRLNFALAIVGNPDLIFLDEPTVGMDIAARRLFWDSIRAMAKQGKTILFSTHYLKEADDISDRIILFHRGTIVADGSPEEMKSMLTSQTLSFIPEDSALLAELSQLNGIMGSRAEGQRLFIETRQVEEVLAFIFQNGYKIKGLRIDQGSLDDAFEQLTADDAEESEQEAV
ncbi:ABC transporter ATP-binding protein [Marinicrinis lubricantis]|uniref:ABC transporter ATP-binding protein n=1 Tax=Marinicrinis lubricantis TaxID=2086470 RepID=A0ABW1ILP7_9BACL